MHPLASGTIASVVFALLATLYLGWFVNQSPPRRLVLAQLADPFGLVAQWFGPAGTPLGLIDRLPVLGLAIVNLLAAYGLGRLAVDWLAEHESGSTVPVERAAAIDPDRRIEFGGDRRTTLTPLERSVFALAVGLNGVSLLVLGGGLLGLLQQGWLAWAVVIAGCGLAGWQLYRDHDSRPDAMRDHWSRLCTAIVFSILIVLGACLPPWDFDVREYHLQVPKEWFQQGHVSFLPHNVYGNMPLGAEMHALLGMALMPGEQGWFYGALSGKVVMASFALLTAAGLYSLGRRLSGGLAGAAAAAIYLAHPWVAHVSVQGLNDGALACYVLLAAYATWLARRGECSFLLAGFLAGGAAAVKYPGLAFAVAPLAVWCCVPRARTIALSLFLAGVLAGGGAWYSKNAVLAGNPVYPLAYSVLGGKSRTPAKDAQWQRAHQVPRNAAGERYSMGQLAGSLLRISGRDDLASPLILPLGLAGVVLLVVLPRISAFHSAIRATHSALGFLLLLAWIFAVWWLVSHRLDRFLIPAWPFAALLAGLAAGWSSRPAWRWAVGAFLALGLLYCLLVNSSPLVGDNRWFVSLEQLRRDEPWPEGTPLRIEPAHQLLNERIEPGQAVLLVGDAEPFDLQMRAYYNTCFDDCLLVDWMQNRSPAERHAQLTSRNIAWLYVDWREIRRYQSPGNYGFDPRFDPRLLDELVRQGVLDRQLRLGPEGAGELYPVPAVLRSTRDATPNTSTPRIAPTTSASQSQPEG
ncbi:MAG: glycosyltransferase family 39 protein [Pirellulaceae bacterium]